MRESNILLALDRQLICSVSRENPIWGGHRIHDKLLKPGIDIDETGVCIYIPRRGGPRYLFCAIEIGFDFVQQFRMMGIKQVWSPPAESWQST